MPPPATDRDVEPLALLDRETEPPAGNGRRWSLTEAQAAPLVQHALRRIPAGHVVVHPVARAAPVSPKPRESHRLVSRRPDDLEPQRARKQHRDRHLNLLHGSEFPRGYQQRDSSYAAARGRSSLPQATAASAGPATSRGRAGPFPLRVPSRSSVRAGRAPPWPVRSRPRSASSGTSSILDFAGRPVQSSAGPGSRGSAAGGTPGCAAATGGLPRRRAAAARSGTQSTSGASAARSGLRGARRTPRAPAASNRGLRGPHGRSTPSCPSRSDGSAVRRMKRYLKPRRKNP